MFASKILITADMKYTRYFFAWVSYLLIKRFYKVIKTAKFPVKTLVEKSTELEKSKMCAVNLVNIQIMSAFVNSCMYIKI